MGSCYSTKANQMPLPAQHSPLSSSSSSSLASRKPNASTAAPAQKSRGFGFNHGKYSRTQPIANSNEISSCKTNGDALKIQPESKSQKVASSPQARFGFKKPPSTGKGAKKPAGGKSTVPAARGSKQSLVSNSVESPKSSGSKVDQNLSQKNKVKGQTGKVTASKKLTYTHKPSTYRPDDNAEWRMIDECESSLADNASAEILSSEPNHRDRARTIDDAANANIPVVIDKVDNRESTTACGRDTKNINDVNGNKRNTIHSKSSSKEKVNAGAMSAGSKLQSRLKKPFVKSKTFSSSHGLKKEDGDLKQARNSVDNGEKMAKGKGVSSSKSSFLKRSFFGRQKNQQPAEKSSHDSDTHKTLDVEVEQAGKNTCTKVQSSTVLDSGEDRHAEEHPRGRSTDTKQPGTILDSDSSSGGETVKPIDLEEDSTASEVRVRSSIPDNLKARLEKADIPKGTAPIAMLESAETASIGSITSDDLMLEMDVDLGDYEEDGQEELSGSRTAHSLIMRTRSGSGHAQGHCQSHLSRSRSNSHEAGKHPDEGRVQSPGGSTVGQTESEGPNAGVGYRYGRAPPRSTMSTVGLEKREQWYKKKGGSSASREETMESVIELHSLMGQPKTQTSLNRRFPRADGKAVRPASFPNFSRQTSEPETATASSTQNEAEAGGAAPTPPHKAHMFKPPRLPSVTDDDRVTVDGFTYRQMSQDLTALKTMLLRLKRVIQEDELGSPIGPPSWKNGLSLGGSQPASPFGRSLDRGFTFTDIGKDKDPERSLQVVLKENEALKNQVEALRQQVEEQDRTIHLLQQQMTKYEQLGTVTIPVGSSHREKEDTKPSVSQSSAALAKDTTCKPPLSQKSVSISAKRSLDYPNSSSSGNPPPKPQTVRSCDSTEGHRPRPAASTTIPECSFSGKQYIANLLADMDHQIQSDMNSLFQNILESPPKPEGSYSDDALKDATENHLETQEGERGCDGQAIKMLRNESSAETMCVIDTPIGNHLMSKTSGEKVLENVTGHKTLQQHPESEDWTSELLQEKKFGAGEGGRHEYLAKCTVKTNEDNVVRQNNVEQKLNSNLRNGYETLCEQAELDIDSMDEAEGIKSGDSKKSAQKGKSIPNKASGIPRQAVLPRYIPKEKPEPSPKEQQTSRFFKFGSFKKVLRSPIKLRSFSEA